ncbi:MAG: VOC family protein [Candidatus Limnocylindria bacterium]
MKVPARVHIITLGVRDLRRAAAFYGALGWERASSSSEEICWFRTAGAYIGLFGRDALARDANLPVTPAAGFSGVTLAINVESEEAVTVALSAAAEAGAKILKPAQRADWGGFSGYFADLDGHAWEVAFNPSFAIGPDGSIVIP